MSRLDRILDECLERIANQESTPEDCLARYPDQAVELSRLFQAASAMRKMPGVQPETVIRQSMRLRVGDFVRQHPRPAVGRAHLFERMRGWRIAAIAIALALIFLAAGTAYAQNALPDGPLYRWKLTSEQVWRSVSPDPLQVDLNIAQRRTREIVLTKGQPEAQKHSLAAYETILGQLEKEARRSGDRKVITQLEMQQIKLGKAGIHVPALDDTLNRLHQWLTSPPPADETPSGNQPAPTPSPTSGQTPSSYAGPLNPLLPLAHLVPIAARITALSG